MKKLDLAVSVHFFQRRFCWMLSSLLDCPENNQIQVSVSFVDEIGEPTVREVLEFFEQFLTIVYMPCSLEEFMMRGYRRDQVVQQSNCDWLFFSDGDLVFPPNFFSVLFHRLDTDLLGVEKMIYSGRANRGTTREMEDLISKHRYPSLIPNPYETLISYRRNGFTNIGAGFCQIANREAILRKIGHYVRPGKSKDFSIKRNVSKFRSDRQFRADLGKIRVDLPELIHMNHLRDTDFDSHLTMMR